MMGIPEPLATGAHKVPEMPPTKPPKQKSDSERIADALERIATALEDQNRRSYKGPF